MRTYPRPMALSLLALAVGCLPSFAQPAVQVADLNLATPGLNLLYFFGSRFLPLDHQMLLSADDGIHGTELWTSDATANGTRLVADFCPGVCSGWPHDFVRLGNRAYFSAFDPAHGVELWTSDGTATGTFRVGDLPAGPESLNPSGLRVLLGRLMFVGSDSAHGQELWTSDGSAAGTRLLVDIFPGKGWSRIIFLAELGGRLYFSADDGARGRELWATDGTAGGTAPIADIFPGPTGALLESGDFPGFLSYGVLGNRIFFPADDGVHGTELWASDGTAAGTTMIADLEPGAEGTWPNYFAAIATTGLAFSGRDPAHGTELWTTDGTAGGTARIELRPGLDYSQPREVVSHGTRAYFTADDGTTGRELWSTDGTAVGTAQVIDLLPGPDSGLTLFGAPHKLTSFAGRLLFFGDDGTHGVESPCRTRQRV